MCCLRLDAVTHAKYECDSKNPTDTLAWSKILLTEKFTNGALVTPTPGWLFYDTRCCLTPWKTARALFRPRLKEAAMASWYNNTFHITDPFWGKSIDHGWITLTKDWWCRALILSLFLDWTPSDYSVGSACCRSHNCLDITTSWHGNDFYLNGSLCVESIDYLGPFY